MMPAHGCQYPSWSQALSAAMSRSRQRTGAGWFIMGSMRSVIQISLLLLCIAVSGMAQTANSAAGAWTQVDRSDPLHQTSFKEFTLTGKFLVPPRQSSLSAPVLVLHCQPGRHGPNRVRTNGRFVEGWIATGAVLDSAKPQAWDSAKLASKLIDFVSVEFRLDDEKLQSDWWPKSTDHSGVFLDDIRLDNLLYGHLLGHKEGTGPQIRRIMLGVPEYLAVQIQMEFDLPDSTEVADACGVILHKR